MGKLYYIDDIRNDLRGICLKKIGEVYPQDVIPAAIARLEYELEALSRIRGGDQAFLETMAFARKLRNLCRGAGSGYKPRISFRGPVLASLIAYLVGISEHDPIALGFYPWIFYEKPSVVEFNFNLPMRAIQMINNYDLNVPKSDVIYLDRDASVIELVEECIPGVLVNYDIPDYRMISSEIKGFFDEAIKKVLTGWIISWDSIRSMFHMPEMYSNICHLMMYSLPVLSSLQNWKDFFIAVSLMMIILAQWIR